jgi:hypothetical protein
VLEKRSLELETALRSVPFIDITPLLVCRLQTPDTAQSRAIPRP